MTLVCGNRFSEMLITSFPGTTRSTAQGSLGLKCVLDFSVCISSKSFVLDSAAPYSLVSFIHSQMLRFTKSLLFLCFFTRDAFSSSLLNSFPSLKTGTCFHASSFRFFFPPVASVLSLNPPRPEHSSLLLRVCLPGVGLQARVEPGLQADPAVALHPGAPEERGVP